MFLLTTNFVKNSHIQAKIFYIILKTLVNQTWNIFNSRFWRQLKDRKSSYLGSEAFDIFCNLIALSLG